MIGGFSREREGGGGIRREKIDESRFDELGDGDQVDRWQERGRLWL